jgi:hypothetical protein
MRTGTTSLMRVLHQEERGQVTAWFVAVLILLFAIMALAIDVGFWFVDRRHAQNQVDAAVLAGVQQLPATNVSAAATAAQDWLNRNNRIHQSSVVSECAADSSEDYELPPGNLGFAFADTDNDGAYDKIRACVRRGSFLLFARLLSLSDMEVNAVAAAGLQQTPLTYALMAMNDTNCAEAPTLNVRGDAVVHLEGDAASYTALACASHTLRVDGNGELTAAYHDVCGTGGTQGSTSTLEPQPVSTNVCQVPDPWLGYAQPVVGDFPEGCQNPSAYGWSDFIFDHPEDNTTPIVLQPGMYCQLVGMNSPTPGDLTVTLAPGTYMFRDGFMANGGTLMTPTAGSNPGVVLYFTCASGACDGTNRPRDLQTNPGPGGLACNGHATLCIQGSAVVDLTAPAELPHILLWVDRDAAAEGQELIRLAGVGSMDFDGHVYAWGGEVEIQGQGTSFNVDIIGTVLGDTIEMAGQGTYTVTWDEDFAPRITSLALVE